MKQIIAKKRVIVEVAVMRIFTIIIQLLFLKIYTNYTSLYDIGIYLFLLTISYSLNSFLFVPLDYFQQALAYKLKNNSISFKSYSGINLWVLKITISFSVIAEIFCLLINPVYYYVIPLISILALSGYFVTLLRGLINNLEKRRQAIYFLLLEGILKILFFLVLITFFKSTSTIILIALAGASLFTLGCLYLFFRNMDEYKYGEIQTFSIKEVFEFSYPISIGAIINWIQLQGYRMILVPFGLVEVVGIYGTVANVGTSGMNAYSTIFAQLFVPDLYKTDGKYIKAYIRNAFLSILFVLGVSYVFSDLIIRILTNQHFVQYSSVIIYGILSEGGNFLIGALTIYLTIHKVTKTSIKVNIVGLLTFFISFYMLYYFKLININTVGIPIVLTQFVIVGYLMIVVYNLVDKHGENV